MFMCAQKIKERQRASGTVPAATRGSDQSHRKGSNWNQEERNLNSERQLYETDKILWHHRDLRRGAPNSFGANQHEAWNH